MSREQPLLEVIEMRDGAIVRVRLRGEFDLAGVPRVTDSMRTLRERREPVLLDLDELEFIDMAGLRAVLAVAEDASRDGQTFAVTRGSPAVRRLAELVGADKQLPLDRSS